MKRKHSFINDQPVSRRPRILHNVLHPAQVRDIDKTTIMDAMDIDVTENIEAQVALIPVNCQVYWGKHKYEVELDFNEPLIVLKAQIFALTQVDPERQKIIYNGRILKEECWPDDTIKNGDKLRMIGTNDVIVMPAVLEDEKIPPKLIAKLPPYGIKNYGNTCYMNSVIQALKAVPELKEAIIKNNQEPNGNEKEIIECVVVKSLAELYKALDQRSETYERFVSEFISTVETLYPEYVGSIEKGGRPQQDANEFFMRIFDILKKNISYQVNQYVKGRTLIETLFGVDVEKQYKCLEKDGDSCKILNETELQLSCYINVDTKFMIDGIKNKLNEIISKNSLLLNRDANFSLNTYITRLPAYLCVQFVRFFYKEKEKVNAKILKDVKFPLRLDVSELCSAPLKERLKPMQAQVREFENKYSLADTESSKRILHKRKEAGSISLPEQKLAPGDSGSGIYQLIAVITHQGRTTTSGHYVAWTRIDDKKWAKLDDSVVTFVDEDEILKLSGGGESHSAYLLIYQAFKVPKV